MGPAGPRELECQSSAEGPLTTEYFSEKLVGRVVGVFAPVIGEARAAAEKAEGHTHGRICRRTGSSTCRSHETWSAWPSAPREGAMSEVSRRELLTARPFLLPEEVIELAVQLQTPGDAHPDAALIRLQAELRIRSVAWMVTMFDDGEGLPPPVTSEDTGEAADAVANAIRAMPAKTTRGLVAHAHAFLWDSRILVDVAADPSNELDWQPKCFLSMLREIERMAEMEAGAVGERTGATA